MSEPIQSVDSPHMLEALETNSAEEMVCFGRGIPGAELHEDPELTWFITHRRSLNGVVRTRLAYNDTAYIDEKIRSTCEHFAAHKVSMNWSISPITQPHNLATHLLEHGFTHRAEDIWMPLDVSTMNDNIAFPANLIITECKDSTLLQTWKSVSQRGFDAFEEGVQTYYENYVNIGFGDGKPWHHYLAWLDDEAVAVASLLLHAGLAGIYGVCTIPEARRKGIGSAITRHALHMAHTLGYAIAILSPTKIAMDMYRRIGFQDFCRSQHYSWTPTQ